MVLTDRSPHDRGQVLLLMAVVIGLLLVGSAITLNYGLFATLDRSEGLSETTVSSDLGYTVESNVHSTIVAANRGTLDFDSEVQRQFEYISRDQRFRQTELDVSVAEKVSGEMLTTERADLTGGGASDWTVFSTGASDFIAGGIAINSTDNSLPVTDSPVSDGALLIDTQTHEIYIYRPVDDSNSIEALFVGDTQATYRATSEGDPYLDLGEGSFDGKLFAGYDQSDVQTVEIENGDRANGSIEFVVTEATSTHGSVSEESAIFGALVDINMRSNNEATEKSIFVSHGPTRGGL